MRDDDNNRDNGEEQLEFEPTDSWPPRDQLYGDLDENEEFEEPDRDSDYASVYTEIEEEEPDLPGDYSEDQLDIVEETSELTSWEEDTTPPAPEPVEPTVENTWTALSSLRSEEHDMDLLPGDTESDDAWEEEAYEEEEEREISLPLGMIVVGIVALVLLGAGGYGVMQDRAALQEEIRQLQAKLATAASPDAVAETRAASEALTSRNGELEQQLSNLSRENRSLQAIIGGLETQLQAQQEVQAKATPPSPPPAPKKAVTEPAPKAPTTSAAPPSAGTWFVNFGSYSQRKTAQTWAGRLKPDNGDVVVTTGEKDGRTFYRVRVINLASQDVANSTARNLEQDYDLSRLWVGRSP